MPKSRLLIGLSALALLGGCKSWLFDKQPDQGNVVNISEANPMDNLVANISDANANVASAADQQCASQPTYDAIKKSLFDAARKKVTTSAAPLTSLQSASVVRMTSPLVVNANAALQRTDCSGQLTLMLPPTASNAFGGSNLLSASLQYSVQQAADHSGTVVQVTGGDTISDQLASATDLLARRKGGSFGGAASTVFAGKTFNPSFNCSGALSNAMRMICQDEDLARSDRAMASAYARAKAETPKPDLPALIQAQRDFIKQRDACPDTVCMKELYDSRSMEIGSEGG